MSRRKGVVLIIDDEEEIRESIELLLNSEGLSTDTAANGEQGLKKIEENSYDAVLLDLMLPGKSGMEVQKQIKRIDPTLPVIIITAIGAVETAVTATKEGSFDYITKPWNNEKLVVIVTNAIKQRQLLSENMQLRRALKERFGYDNIVGKSEKILRKADEQAEITGRPGGGEPQYGPRPGGERHRQGACGESHPSQKPAGRQSICSGEQRQHAGGPSGKHVVWPRAGRIHKRDRIEAWSV